MQQQILTDVRDGTLFSLLEYDVHILEELFVGSYRGDRILLATPLLDWYLEHGFEVTSVTRCPQPDARETLMPTKP